MYLLGGVFHWFGEPPSELPDHETIIPIDLMMSEGDSPGGPGPEMPKPTIATLEEAPTSIPRAVDPVDAGAPTMDAEPPGPDAAPEGPDAAPQTPDAAPDAEKQLADADIPDSTQDATGTKDAAVIASDADVMADATAASDVVVPLLDAAVASSDPLDASPSAVPDAAVGGDGGRPDAQPFRPIRDPVGLSGDAQKIAPRDPNVSLLIYPERIRDHRLAVQFAPTLTKLQNWRNFFGGTELDPVRDTDRILLAGPQLRDSSRVVAVVRYNVPQARVRSAIDVVVKRSGSRGQWENKRVPVAKAHVDGAERYFVMTGPNMLVVVPPDGLEQALKLPANLRFPSVGNEAVVLFLKYPANAFRGMPVKLPRSVEWMRFSLSLNPKGGADARLDAKDKDAETAAKNAPELTETINKAMVVDLIFTKRRLLDPVTFRAEGDHIRAETHVTDAQLRHILSFMAAKIEQVDREVPAPAGSR